MTGIGSWIRSRVGLKVTIPIGVVMCVTIAGVLVMSLRKARDEVNRTGGANLADCSAEFFREEMAVGDTAGVRKSLKDFGEHVVGVEVFVINTKGKVAYSTRAADVGKESSANTADPTVLAAIGGILKPGGEKTPQTMVEERVGGEPRLTIIRPIPNTAECAACHSGKGGVMGAMVVRQSLARTYTEVAAMTRQSLILGLVGCLVAIILAYLVIARVVVRPLRAMGEIADRVASGNLRQQEAWTGSDDEIGSLGAALVRMTASLREVLASLSAMAERLASASHEISVSTEQMSRTAENQAKTTAHVATAAEEMSSMIIGVAKSATGILEGCRESTRTAEKGNEAVGGTVRGIESIAGSAKGARSTIEDLGKRLAQIHRVAEAIDEIAYQTKILSCNAAIEAARAGEHGRGFAVVAGEVKDLANTASRSTQEIREMIRAIQDEAGLAVDAIREVDRQATVGTELSNGARMALDEIVGGSGRMTSMVNQIAAATEEQSMAAEDIAKNAESIAGAAKDGSAAVSQVSQTAHDLARQAEEMRQLVGHFQI